MSADVVPLVHEEAANGIVDSTSKPQRDAGIVGTETSTMIVHANFLLKATKFGEIAFSSIQ